MKERSLYFTPRFIDVKAANFKVYFGLLAYSEAECFLKSEVCDSLASLNDYNIEISYVSV